MKLNIRDSWPQIVFVAFHTLVAFYFICFHFHPAELDFAGHISSAKYFSEGYFYAFDDNHFLGYIHNLFYPPLQDICISFFALFTGKNFVQAGIIYAAVLYFCYLISFVYLAGVLKNIWVRIGFLFISSLWLLVDKNTQIGLGTSLHDLIFMGLSAQLLGMIFFFILLRMVLEKKDSPLLIVLMALSFLSHIFVGLFSIAVLVGYGLCQRKYLLHVLLGLGLTAFVWLPFFSNSRYIAQYTIFDKHESKIIVLLVINVFLYIYFKKKYAVFLIGSFFILLMNWYGCYVDIHHMALPTFHYYRLMPYAYLFILLQMSLDFSDNFQGWRNPLLYFSLLAAVIFTFKYNGARFMDTMLLTQFNYNNHKTALVDGVEYNRTYVPPNISPEDQTLPQYLQSLPENEFKSAQGIYWGASKSDYLLSSYNTMLFKTRHGMIDYFTILSQNCNVQACFLDAFLRDYNIGHIVVDPYLHFSSLPPFQQACMRVIYQGLQTSKNVFQYENQVELLYPELNKSLPLSVYRIENKVQNAFDNNSALEIIPKGASIMYYNPMEKFYFGEYFKTLNVFCNERVKSPGLTFGIYYLSDDFKDKKVDFNQNPSSFEMAKMNFKKEKINHYKISIQSETPIWFKIKLSWFPGFELRDEKGNLLPLVQGIGYMLGQGHGTMSLVYRSPALFKISYIVSIFFFMILILYWRRTYPHKKNKV